MPIELFEHLIVHHYGCVVEVVAAGREVAPNALIQILASGGAQEARPITEGSSIVLCVLFIKFGPLDRASHPLSVLVLNPTVRRHGDINGRARLRIMMMC